MSKFAPNPKKVQNYTQAGEKTVFVGKRKSVDLLPTVLQTEPNKMFLDTTIDNLLSSGTTETLNTYWGRISGKSYQPETDLFNSEHRAARLNYQLAPGMSVAGTDGSTDVSSYINMIDALNNAGADISDINALMAVEGQTLDLPINIDMFVNYNNYYWLSSDVPVCEINADAADPIDIDDITKFSNYTTPVLSNDKTLDFLNGMAVKFTGSNVSSTSGDYVVDAIYIIDGVGTENIKLVMLEDENGNIIFNRVQAYSRTIPADPGEIPVRVPVNSQKDYVVMNRSAIDKNSWARANQWYSIHAIKESVNYNELDLSDYANTDTRGSRPIIEFDANMELFGAGEITGDVIDDVEHIFTDGTVAVDSDIVNIDIDVFEYGGTKLKVGERILFLATTSTIDPGFAGYNKRIYEVAVDGSNQIILNVVLNPISPGLTDNSKVLVNNAMGDESLAGSEWVWSSDASTWKIGQYKKSRGQAPLFNLYDIDGEQIFGSADEAFSGEPIWRYAVNTAGVIDNELGFAPKYNSQIPNDIVFEFTLNNNRYKVDVTNEFKREISGDYFFKDINTGEIKGCWNTIRDEQFVPVILTHIQNEDAASVTVDLGTTLLSRSTEYDVVFDKNEYRWAQPTYTGSSRIDEPNPVMVFKKDTAYTINALISNSVNAIEFVDPTGNTNADIVVSQTGDVITLTINSAYPYSSIRYRNTTDNTISGMIYLSDTSQSTVFVRKNGTIQSDDTYTINGSELTHNVAASEGDIFDITLMPQEKIDDAVYDIAPAVKYNPTNTRINTVSFTQMYTHFEDQIMRMPGHEGNIFGLNTYHKIPRLHNYGGTIRRQIYSPAKLAYMVKHNQLNPFNAINSVATDYTVFKNAFKNKIKQLWKTNADLTIREMVNEALRQINIGKNEFFKYAKSDMAYYENYQQTENTSQGGQPDVQLPKSLNIYGDTQNHIQVWAYEYDGISKNIWKPLVRDVDYSIDVNNFSMLRPLTYDGITDTIIRVNWYDHKNVSFIPPSVVKLGFKKPSQIEVLNGKLHMHDGSVYEMSGTEIFDKDSSNFDVVAAAFYDLELRVYNNLVTKHYAITDMHVFAPNANHATGYDWNDTNNKLDDWYNRWLLNREGYTAIPDFSAADYYQVGDAFTWNYSSVAPFIGGWEGLYTYFFGTTRPHTHPWEMLGHNTKPTWWDANYSWTDTAPGGGREKLINALKYGITGNPADEGTIVIQQVDYAKTAYDWDANTLVTTSGVLQDPVTAGVTASPAPIDASREFTFGDWGPSESNWRHTSDYQYALFETLLQLKPVLIHETYWELANIAINENAAHHVKYNVNYDGILPLSYGYDLHNDQPDGGFVASVDIKSGGTGHNNNTSLELTTNSVVEATFDLFVNAGAIAGVSVTNPGSGYESDAEIDAISSFGEDELIVARIDTTTTLPKMGVNNVVIEWSSTFGQSAESINQMIARVEPKLSLHMGGYTDKDILDLIVDTSLNGGRVSIPAQDYSITLSSGVPVKRFFYSGIVISRTTRGFSVTGYGTQNRNFKYYLPSTGGTVVTESVGNVSVDRFVNFKEQIDEVPYGFEFVKRQELFNFIVGLGKYYERNNFDVYQQWIIDAKAVLTWSLTAETGDTTHANGIQNKLVYNQGQRGFVQNIDVVYNGFNNAFDMDRADLNSDDLLVLRDFESTEIQTKDSARNIYGLHVHIVEYEHVLSIANTTQFNDIVYDPIIGLSVERIRVEGERTRQWNGRVEAPGYIIQEDGIITNFESSVREVERDLINSESKVLNKSTKRTARFNVGYKQPTYLAETFVEDNTSYQFSKGVRKYKGTTIAIDAFAKNRGVFGSEYDYTLNEEWMIRMGDYGDKQRRNPIEVEINPDLIKSSPQLIKFNDTQVVDRSGDTVIDIGINDARLITSYTAEPFNMLPIQYADDESIEQTEIFNTHFKTSGLPRIDEVDVTLRSVDDMANVYDPESEYAQITNWENKVSYKLGDRVRFEGKAYEAIVNNTGIDLDYNDIVVAGSVFGPTVDSIEPNLFLILDGEFVNFYKSELSTTFSVASATGNVVDPSTPSGTNLIINGSTVSFEKTEDTIVYEPIVFTGTVLNPSVTGNAGSVFKVDSYEIDFESYEQLTTNITTKDAVEITLVQDAGVDAGTADTLSTARVTAFVNLRTAYIADGFSEPQWVTWLQGYFESATQYEPAGLNVAYLQSELTAASGTGYETAISDLLDNDVDIVNAIEGTSYTAITATGPAWELNLADAIALFDNGQYIDDYTARLLTGNASITLSDVVATESSDGDPIEWNLTEIIDHLNATLSPTNITASAGGNDNNRLSITKIPTVGDTSMTIFDVDPDTGSNDILTEVGIPAGTKESPGSEVVQSVELTLVDIINAINTASIENVTASASESKLVITASSGNLVIGPGSANNNVGISQGTYVPSEITETTSPIQLQIYDIVNQINAAGLDGITASNVGNNVVLTSTNQQLDIGPGSANALIGFEEGIVEATTVKSNTWEPTEWQEIIDPAVFSIWVTDDAGFSGDINRFDGYNVYQVLDFNLEVEHICAGIINTDDAKIELSNPIQIQAGDYIMILGSTCTPSIDGIHTVKEVDVNNNHFLIDEFIEEEGFGGKAFVVRSTRFSTTDDLFATGIPTETRYYADEGESGWQPGMLAYVDNDNNTGVGAVYEILASTDQGIAFKKVRSQIAKVDNSQIENVVIYDPTTSKTKATLEVFDPIKGILPGIITKEVNYVHDNDVAVYNRTTDLNYTTDDSNFWSDNVEADVWWDISNAIYIDYEQDDVIYTQSNWGRLYPTSTIDIYEWTKSPVPPEEYVDAVQSATVIDGVVLSGEPYVQLNASGESEYYWSEEILFDVETNSEQTYYYFWVKNKTTVPNDTRQYTTIQLAELIRDPLQFGLSWAAACSSRQVLINALERFIEYGSDVVQINFANKEVNHHQEYILMAEHDPKLAIPEWLHNRLRDSIASHDVATIKSTYTTWDAGTTYNVNDIVKLNDIFYIANVTSISVDPSTNASQTYVQSAQPWSVLSNVTDNPDGSVEYFDDGGTRTSVEYVEYLSPNVVPDYNLHKLNRYGNEIRPRQSWFIDITTARRTFIEILNEKIGSVNLIDSTLKWEDAISQMTIDGLHSNALTDYWAWENWTSPSYVTNKPSHYVTVVSDLSSLTPDLGDYALVQESTYADEINRESIYEFTTNGWELRWKEKATIKFLDLLWDYAGYNQGWGAGVWNGGVYNFDPAYYLSTILDIVRNNIFVDQYNGLYNELWFSMMQYSMGEQPNLDWAFKTSYVKLALSVNIDEQPKKFIKYRDDVLTDFINEVKPYHTKLRDVILDRTVSDEMSMTLDEISRSMVITERLNQFDIDNTVWTDLIVDGNDPDSGDTDSMEFTTLEGDIQYVYDGGDFIDAGNYTHDPELVPTSLAEAFEIRVNTNVSGATVDANSREFRMFHGITNYEASVINTQTTLASSISSTETTIEVIDSSVLWTPSEGENGVVWIGSERIEYTHKEGNFLKNCVRHSGGTSNQIHTAGDVVYEGGIPMKIPALDYRDYGDNLRPAFNDYGKSITDNTSVSPEAVFVYQNG